MTIDIPATFAHLRRFPMTDALLLFDRDTGLNVLCDGPETAGLRPIAPRVIQFGITNRCNLACTFCSRDLAAESGWTADSAFELLAALAAAGVLEVAFGGGEPFTFRGFAELVRRLHDETPLAVHVTTNGLALTAERLAALAGAIGQLRLSLYDDNDWRARVSLLAASDVRFGVNYLVTPARLPLLATTILDLAARGCRDVLLLSYNGRDATLHLSAAETVALAADVQLLARALPRCRLALDVCWGERLEAVPRLFATGDCGGRRVPRHHKRSARHAVQLSRRNTADPRRGRRHESLARSAAVLARPSRLPGCARTPGFGLRSVS